jgi:hypothetical protein
MDDFTDYIGKNFNVVISNDFCINSKENDFDVVVGTPVVGGEFATSYSEKFKVPLYLVMFESPNWVAKYREGADSTEDFWAGYKKCLEKADKILVPSYESSKQLRAWGNFNNKVIDVIYPCINQIVADRIKEENTEPFNNNKINILFLSRMIPGKSPLSIIKQLKSENYCFHIIGKIWPEENRLIGKLRKDGLDIVTHGTINDYEKFRLIKKCDLVIFPSNFEGFGMPPMEALYFGKPVICYDLPVLREIYSDKLIYVERGNVMDFCTAVKKECHLIQSMTGPASNKIELPFQTIRNCSNKLLDTFNIPRITAGIIVYNGEDYLEQAVESIYSVVNEIIIVEGCVKGYDKNVFGKSDDNTWMILNKLKQKDHLDKIQIYCSDRPWKDKMEMQNEIARRVTGKYYVKVDHDEIWKPETLVEVINMMEEDKSIDIMRMPFLHFWLNFNTIARDEGGKWSTKHPRVWRWKQGFIHTKSFNFFVDSLNYNRKVCSPEYKEVVYNGSEFIYHFGYCRKLKTLQEKLLYYGTRGIEKFAKDTVTNYKEGDPTQPTQWEQSWAEPFNGILPEILNNHPYKTLKDIRRCEENGNTQQ